MYTVKPPNKENVGDNNFIINSHALSLVERLSSSRRFKLYTATIYRETEFSGRLHELSSVERFIIIQCPFLEGATIECNDNQYSLVIMMIN